MTWPTHFIVNRTEHLMPPYFVVAEYEAAYERSGRDVRTFEWAPRCIDVARQRLLLEHLRAKHGPRAGMRKRRVKR